MKIEFVEKNYDIGTKLKNLMQKKVLLFCLTTFLIMLKKKNRKKTAKIKRSLPLYYLLQRSYLKCPNNLEKCSKQIIFARTLNAALTDSMKSVAKSTKLCMLLPANTSIFARTSLLKNWKPWKLRNFNLKSLLSFLTIIFLTG